MMVRMVVASLLVAACATAIGQNTNCPNDALDAGSASSSGAQPCAPSEAIQRREVAERIAVRAIEPDSERNPLMQPRVIVPPGAVMKKVLPPDPNKEERMLRERVHRALRNNDRGKPAMSPECQLIVEQIAGQQPLQRSLRAESRTQARERVTVLTNEFRDRGC